MSLMLQNFILFQIGWFSCVVGGASSEYYWIGVVAVMVIIAIHLARADNVQNEILLIMATLLLGMLAVPLSRAAPRHGRSYSLVIAIAVYAAIFNLAGMARTWVERGEVSPQIGIWWVHLLMLCLVFTLLFGKRWFRG